MKIHLQNLFFAVVLFVSVHQAVAQGTTAFTYQGQLHDNGTNANGACTLIFKVYDALTSGNQIGSGITNNVPLANGLFSVNLDFGAGVFNGAARWLDITITNGGVTQTLSPRVQVLPTPYAQYAAVAATVTNGGIMNAQLANNAVALTNIQNGAITNRSLTANAVNATNIASGQVIKSLNGLTDNVIVTAGTNVSLFTNGNALVISAGVPNVQFFKNVSTTFTVPTNVARIMVEMWGAGGNGGSGYSSPLNGNGIGGGGGAGAYAMSVLTVTPGSSYNVIAPAGPVGNGQAGGQASFSGNSISIVAGGGSGGGNATINSNGNGGAGGNATGGFANAQGGNGDSNGNGGGSWRGGAGSLQSGASGNGPGAGGSGSGPGGGSGISASSGAVLISY